MMQQQSSREQGGEGGHQVTDGEDCGGARRQQQQQQSVKERGNATPAPPTPTATASFASPPTSSTNNKVGNAALISSNGNGNAANPPKTPTIRRKQQLISPGCAAVRVWPAGTESTQPAKADSKGVNNKAAVPMSREELQPIFTDLNGHSQEKGSQKSTATEKEGRENGLSAFPTALNFVKGMLGPGCLSIPLIFRQSGLIMGLLLIFLFGLVSTKCMLQLVNCSQHLSKKKRHQFLDYGDVAFEALAQGFRPLRQYAEMGRVAVNASIVCLQVGICSVSVVFLAAHLKQVFDELFSISLGQQQWILLVAGPLILINFIRTLHKIVFLSIIGSVFMFSALAIIFQHLLRAKHISLWGLPWFTDLNGVISAAGAVLYAYEGQAMVLPLENKLRDPSQMGGPLGILSSSMGFVSLVYALCGFIGFATYGQQVKGSIALNLPQDEILFTAVRLMLTLVVFVGFVIQQYVVVEIVWPKVRAMLFARRHSSSKIFFWEMGLRTALVLLAVTIAYVVPNLERIIPLVGMSAGMLLAIVFPAFLDTLTFLPAEIEHGQMGKCFARLAQNSMLGLIGLFALIGGVEANLVDLIRKNG